MKRKAHLGAKALILAGVVALFLPLAIGPARADSTTELVNDSVALALDTAKRPADCNPGSVDWTPISPTATPYTQNATLWYSETGGAKVKFTCFTKWRMKVRITDDFGQLYPRSALGQVDQWSNGGQLVTTVEVPYAGLDQPVPRVIGRITVHAEIVQLVKNPLTKKDMEAPIKDGCREYVYLHEGGSNTITQDPTSDTSTKSNCAYDVQGAIQDTIYSPTIIRFQQ